MEFFKDINISKMDDAYIFGGKAEICKEFSFQSPNHGDVNIKAKQPTVDVSEAQPIRRVDKKDMNDQESTKDQEPAAVRRTSSFVVPTDTYKTLLEDLYMVRLCSLRARNITMNQLDVYQKEAIEHMQEIKRIILDELENSEASADALAKELFEAGTEVIRIEQALIRTEMEELVKNLDMLLNTLRSDVKEIKSLADPESEEEKENRSCMDLLWDYGHWCLFVLYISIILFVGLIRYSPEFENYFN